MSSVIECRATRRGRAWVAHLPEHGVYGHGRTLKAVRDSIAEGLAFVGVSAQVTLIPVTPELERLRAAQDACAAVLTDAVTALALRRTNISDIAQATGASVKRVKTLLAEHPPHPAQRSLSEAGTTEPFDERLRDAAEEKG
jgi:hypothetical protein